MAQAARKKKATSAHRKVQSSTVRSRKNTKRTEKKVPEESNSVEVKVMIKPSAKKEPEVMMPEQPKEASVSAEPSTEQIVPISRFGLDATPDLLESQIEQIQAAQEEVKEPEVEPETEEKNVLKIDVTEEAKAMMTEESANEEPAPEKSMAEEPVAEEPIVEKSIEEPVPVKETETEKEKQEEAVVEKVLAKAASEKSKFDKSSKKSFGRSHYHSRQRVSFGFKRVVLALACAAAAVFAIVYFVNLNSPDISLKVAAMQSGIEAKYPTYIPRDFNLSDITSENGKITLNFRNSSTGDAFSIIEEKSSWDSTALYENYVKYTYGDNYTLIRDQETTRGLALYISNSDACWVNGGVVYKLKTTSGSLTKKQIKAIAVSL